MALKLLFSALASVKGMSPKIRIGLLCSPVLLYFLWNFGVYFISPPKQVTAPNKAAQVNAILVSSPAALGQAMPEQGPTLYAQRIAQGLIAYEDALDNRLDGVLGALITKEAARLRETAIHELSSVDNPTPGQAVDADRYGLLMSQCESVLTSVDCILLRYIGDGMAMLEAGEKQNDPTLYAAGRIRIQAAGLALFPRDPIQHQGTPMESLRKYRSDLFALIPNLPARRTVGTGTEAAPIQDFSNVAQYLDAHQIRVSPVSNMIHQNPALQTDTTE